MARRYLNATEKQLLESIWIEHTRRCARCATFDRAKPATLANTCLKGAEIIKELLVYESERAHSATRRKDRRSFHRRAQPLW